MNAPTPKLLSLEHQKKQPIIWIPDIDAEAGIGPLPGIGVYPPRQIVMANQKDLFIVNQQTRTAIQTLLKYYHEIGLPHIEPDNVIYLRYNRKTLDSAAREYRRDIGRIVKSMETNPKVIPFITTALTLQAAEYWGATTDIASQKIVEEANNKAALVQAGQERNFTCHAGILVHNTAEARTAIESIFTKHNAICIKEVRAASGLGVHKAYDNTQAMVIAARILRKNLKKGILVEPWLEMDKTRGCPSIQIEVGASSDKDQIFTATRQILGGEDGTTHLGNINAPEILDHQKVQIQIHQVLDWLRHIGFRGIAGIDLFATAGSAADEYLIGEVNARHTGVTAAMYAVEKCRGTIRDIPWAVHNNIKVPYNLTPEACLAQLKADGLLYLPDTKTGFLPTNLAALKHGKLMGVCIANDTEQRDGLLAKMALTFTA